MYNTMEEIKTEIFWKSFYQSFLNETIDLYKNEGLNYDIPKEDQFRCSLYSFLRQKGFNVEVESNLLINEKKRIKYKSTLRFDLRVLGVKDTLIELKRAYGLDIWHNDYKYFLNSWKKDIIKLNSLEDDNYDLQFIKINPDKLFVLFVFYDNPKKYDKIMQKLVLFREFLKDEWKNFKEYSSETNVIYETKQNSIKSEKNDILMKMFVWIN